MKEFGKMPSESARLIMVVIGKTSESRQDFRRKVGIMSKEQEALDDMSMALWISAGANDE